MLGDEAYRGVDGGVVGYICSAGNDEPETLKRAMVRGTVAASFTIEDFSLDAVRDLTKAQIDQRVDGFLNMMRFD